MSLFRNSVWQMGVAFIAVFAMLLSGIGIGVASAVEGDGIYNPDAPAVEVGTDGSKTKVSVKLYKDMEHMAPFDSTVDKLQVGGTLYGYIEWDWDDSEKPTLESPTRFYTFPDNIGVKNVNPSELFDNQGNVAGTWWITNGVAYEKWNEDWLRQHPSDIKSFVSFEFTLKDDGTGDSDNETVNFPGTNSSITITFDKTKVNGSKNWIVNDDGTVTFTVTLGNKFDVNNMVVTDTMGANFRFVTGSFQLDGADIPAYNISVNGQQATIRLGDVKTADGDGHKLTYKATLSEEALKLLAQGKKLDDAKNTATWQWDGSNPGDGQPNGADTTPDLSYQMVAKSDGAADGNAGIKWTVDLNGGQLKADMGRYVFTDTLQTGHHYDGSYTIYKGTNENNENVYATGTLDSNANSFTYTFPKDAGRQQYRIVYHTKLDDPQSHNAVINNATITPPDPTNQPGDSDDGVFTPDVDYIHKRLDSSASTNDAGEATWTSTIYTSRMPDSTDPTTLEFADVLTGKPQGATFHFKDKPTFKVGDTILVEGTDYDFTRSFVPGETTSFNVKFKGDTVKATFGKTDIIVTYTTVCSKAPGDYANRSVVKFGNNPSQGYNATDHIEKTNLVSKSGKLRWDKDFKWNVIDTNDTSVGAWVADWTVVVNEDADPNNHHGLVNTEGKPIVVQETLPEGMRYVPGGTYDIQAGLDVGPFTDQNLDNTITSNNNGRIEFTIPTDNLRQNDGYYKAFATLTYRTAAKSAGKDVSYTNTASASTGSTNLGSSSATVTGGNNVVDKTAVAEEKLNHVRYTILVNPEGVDIAKDSDTVTLSDVMDSKGTFLPGSLNITDDATGDAIDVPVQLDDIVDADGNPTQKLTLTLPDSMPVRVVYAVMPSGKPGDKVNLKNVATLEGQMGGSSTNENQWSVTNAQAGTVGTAGAIAITKVDASNVSRFLQGAEFALYKVDMDKLDRVLSPGSKATDEMIEGAATKVYTDTTGPNGTLEFGTVEEPLENYALYYFVETKAPTFTGSDGVDVHYSLDSAKHYAMIKGDDDQAYENAIAKARRLGVAVSPNTAFTVTDKRIPIPIKASMKLGKQLSGRAWTDADAFDFQLTIDPSGSRGVNESDLVGAMPKPDTVTVRKSGSGANGSVSPVTFGDFTFTKPGTYAYGVHETSQPGNGVTVDSRMARVTFTVVRNAAGDLTVTSRTSGLNDVNGTQTFVNTYSSMTALPLTGGFGTPRSWAIIGGLLAAMASITMVIVDRRRRDM
ncbi:Spy0128 family protein [Bifidobacterium tissieri]|uniref:Isopeptide-forming domain-containing fimbrial protein n=1 Tax=Bifidobacterium tissieri TaxID=1630162 RepID=A0A5M9ZTM3_9BIFI|nr:FctA domain-containing protein [Bifidobacterium tissieri]KAA8830799.1 isopeptide-forming domain-containing fimbrial protein [Bifidobacterium tissieri]KAA8832811.1 isopeptide-forming domain-containing fimbrial protein [Bifidobacterium tissieri]